MQIRGLAIQRLINVPEHFIESNTEQSWLHYLQSMSRQGTWAKNNIIQAVANAYNLTINVTGTARNFTEITVVQSVSLSGNTRCINIGHLDEMLYVFTATSHFNQPDIASEKQTYLNNNDKINNKNNVPVSVRPTETTNFNNSNAKTSIKNLIKVEMSTCKNA